MLSLQQSPGPVVGRDTVNVADLTTQNQINSGISAYHDSCGGFLSSLASSSTFGPEALARSSCDFTRLHVAARNGDLAEVRLLARHSLDLEAKCSKRGFTPLLCACHQGHVEAAHALIQAGADVRVRCNQGWGVVHHLVARMSLQYCHQAPEHLEALLSAISGKAGCDSQQSPSPLDVLLLLPLKYNCQAGSTDPYRPWDYTPVLASLLIKAGCQVDTPLPTPSARPLVEEWLQQVMELEGEGGWPLRLTHPPLLDTAAVLLHAVASSARSACSACSAQHGDPPLGSMRSGRTRGHGGSGWGGDEGQGREAVRGSAFLAAAVRSGSLDLVKVVLQAFPQAPLWRGQESRSPLSLALEFLRPLPPQESWIGRYLRKAIHWCQLSDVLLQAGCQPLQLSIRGQKPAPPLVAGPCATLDLPPWACQPLSFLPLQASGLGWTPSTHPAFPASFCVAARTLLLAHGRQAASGQLPRLPSELLEHIVLLASRPLPHWSPALRYYMQGAADD